MYYCTFAEQREKYWNRRGGGKQTVTNQQNLYELAFTMNLYQIKKSVYFIFNLIQMNLETKSAAETKLMKFKIKVSPNNLFAANDSIAIGKGRKEKTSLNTDESG